MSIARPGQGAVQAILDAQMRAATVAARQLAATGHRVSRRTLRAAGLHSSNAHLGTLARYFTELQAAGWPAQQ